MKILTFDLEIKNCIPQKGKANNPRYKYCKGWKDYEGMGISLAGAATNWMDVEAVMFTEENITGLVDLFQEADLVCGYNLFGFDIGLLKATLVRLGHPEKTGLAGKTYDVFYDLRRQLPDDVKWPKLDDIAWATIRKKKNGDGANAPRLYQDKKMADLTAYLHNDLAIEHQLNLHALEYGTVNHPEEGFITLEKIKPHRAKYLEYLVNKLPTEEKNEQPD